MFCISNNSGSDKIFVEVIKFLFFHFLVWYLDWMVILLPELMSLISCILLAFWKSRNVGAFLNIHSIQFLLLSFEFASMAATIAFDVCFLKSLNISDSKKPSFAEAIKWVWFGIITHAYNWKPFYQCSILDFQSQFHCNLFL